MKTLLILAAMALPLSGAESLNDFKWKKRLLVVTQNSPELDAKLFVEKAALTERDVQIFVLKGPTEAGEVAKGDFANALAKKVQPKESTPEVILIGKDGNTTLRWKASEFKAADLLAKIDSMPMRKDEMKK